MSTYKSGSGQLITGSQAHQCCAKDAVEVARREKLSRQCIQVVLQLSNRLLGSTPLVVLEPMR